jgi:hypothetical protein
MYEILEKRSQYAKHFNNENKTNTAQISPAPIHYKDENNTWQDIELNIIPERNWEFEYALKKNTFKAYFNDITDINNNTLTGFELINSNGVSRWINYKLFGANPTANSYQANVFRYDNVFENIDLEYDITSVRLKEKIIIKQPTDSFSFTFTLKLDAGLRLEEQPNKDIYFIDIDTNEVLWKIEAPFAFDSNQRKHETRNVNYTFGKQIHNDVEYDSITISLDDIEFIQNAIYPIIIDPSTTHYSTTADSDFKSNSTNYSTARAGSGFATYPTDNEIWCGQLTGYDIYRLYLPFDTSSLPDICTITGVTLRLYVSSVTGSGFTIGVVPYNGTSLSANSTCWNYYGSTFYSNALTPVTGNNTITLNNFTAINKTGTTYLGLRSNKDVNGTTPTDDEYVKVRSSDYTGTTYDPLLTITYSTNTAPTVPVLTYPNGGQTLYKTATITWNTSTDAESNPIQYNVIASKDGGATTTEIISLTNNTNVDYNFKNLTPDANWKIGVRAFDGTDYSVYDWSDTVFAVVATDTYAKPSGVYIPCLVYKKQGGVYTLLKVYDKSGTYTEI